MWNHYVYSRMCMRIKLREVGAESYVKNRKYIFKKSCELENNFVSSLCVVLVLGYLYFWISFFLI